MYTFLQYYWWAVVSLLGALLVFLLFVQGGNSMLFCIGKTDQSRKLMQADPHVLLCNVSVRGHGLKVIVAYRPEDDLMPTGWESCKAFYSVAYTTIAAYFQHTYGCAIDTSGKDMVATDW